MRVLLAVLACLAASPACAKPDSVCPPAGGERDTMVGNIVTVGQNKRIGELCKVDPQRIQKMVDGSLAGFKPCLRELGVNDAEIQAALAKGAALGQDVFNRSGVKESLCAKTREDFGN